MLENSKKLYSIGEVSQLKNISVKALRYYHEEGILVPAHVNEQNGYRYYSLDQFLHIDIIKICRELGTTIEELKSLLVTNDTDGLFEFARAKRFEAEAKIAKLSQIINSIDSLVNDFSESRSLIGRDEIFSYPIGKRFAVALPCSDEFDLSELLYYSELDAILEKKKIEKSFKRGLVYRVSKNRSLQARKAFCLIEKGKKKLLEKNIFVLPAGNYVTIVYNAKNGEVQRGRLFDFLKENQLKPRLYLELEILDNLFDLSDYHRQIQVLV
ncbi:MAG: MerR family transcriptional regulator [Spirochaetales bacterium]|nr:MerR family transcriptional regulator [Spirochaetales bacterium]